MTRNAAIDKVTLACDRVRTTVKDGFFAKFDESAARMTREQAIRAVRPYAIEDPTALVSALGLLKLDEPAPPPRLGYDRLSIPTDYGYVSVRENEAVMALRLAGYTVRAPVTREQAIKTAAAACDRVMELRRAADLDGPLETRKPGRP
jgi:hypothetical protein